MPSAFAAFCDATLTFTFPNDVDADGEEDGDAFPDGEEDAFGEAGLAEDEGSGDPAGDTLAGAEVFAGAAAFPEVEPVVLTQIGAEPARTAEEPIVTVALPADGHAVFGACHCFIFGTDAFLPCTWWTRTGFMCFTGGLTAVAAAGGAWDSNPTREHTARTSGIRSLRATRP